MEQRFLRVHANPYHALDAEHRPACVVQMVDHRGVMLRDRWVGAHLHNPVSVSEDANVFVFETDEKDELVEVKVPLGTGYYERQILDGALVAADLESGLAVGLTAEEFEKGLDQLEVEKQLALDRFKAAWPNKKAPDLKFHTTGAERQKAAAAAAKASAPKQSGTLLPPVTDFQHDDQDASAAGKEHV